MEVLTSDDRERLQCLTLNLWIGVRPLPEPSGLPPRALNSLRLRSLSLSNLPLMSPQPLFGTSWTEIVTGLLRNSPELEYLQMSGGGGTQTVNIHYMFVNLCNDYMSSGGRPLRLRMLNLGEGMMLAPIINHPRPYAVAPTYLNQLTRPEFLEELHLWNHPLSGHAPLQLSYGLISPRVCPRLRRVYIAIVDCFAFRYLAAAFRNPRTTHYIRRLELHVDRPGWFGSFLRPPRHPGKPRAMGLDSADLFSSLDRPLRPAGLSLLGPIVIGTTMMPVLARPWHNLRSLRITLTDVQVSGFGLTCRFYTGSLESLLVWVNVDASRTNVARLGETVEKCALVIARWNLRLENVKFEAFAASWSQRVFYSWKKKLPGPLYWNMEAARIRSQCGNVAAEPEAFWPEARKILYLADGDLY